MGNGASVGVFEGKVGVGEKGQRMVIGMWVARWYTFNLSLWIGLIKYGCFVSSIGLAVCSHPYEPLFILVATANFP